MPLAVFDLDGTLVDSLGDLADSANILLERHGARPLDDEEIAAMVGDGVGNLVRRLLNARGLTALEPRRVVGQFLEIYDERLLHRTRPYDGMVEALSRLQHAVDLAVLTNKPAAATERILEGLDLRPFFRWVTGGDGPEGRKPDPRGLIAIMAAAGSGAGDTLMIGDTSVDAETARAAGVRVCLARYGFGYRTRPPQERPDELAVDDPRDLPRVVLAALEP